jgi:hypothetical protein
MLFCLRNTVWLGDQMIGDQGSTGHKIDVYKQRGGFVLHKQVEQRDGRTFMRLRKFSVMDLVGC